MAETTLLYKVTKAKLGSIELDASLSETHSGTVQVTDHPVESGFNVSDHARAEPETLTLEGFISNTPLENETRTNQNGAPVPPEGRYTDANGREFTWNAVAEGEAGRAERAYADLRTLKDAGTLVEVATALRSYENMIITSLTVPRDAGTGNGLRFTATLKQIRKVDAQVTTPTPRVAEPKLAPKTRTNKKATETPAYPQSILRQLGTAVTNGVKSLGLVQ